MNHIKKYLICWIVCLFVGNVCTADDKKFTDNKEFADVKEFADDKEFADENITSGHLQPLCSHPPLHGIATMYEVPTPEYFYEWFVKPGQPVLFKSVLENMDYPAYTLWTDEYLKKRYGQIEVDVEQNKKETRDTPTIQTIEKFLTNYKNNDIYMAHGIPWDMLDEIALPRCLRCGGFWQRLTNNYIWFSSGGTKSVLHRDSYDNINCIFDGSKELIFIDKKHTDRIEADGFVDDGSYSKVDVDKVDLKKFPKLENIPWIKGRMEKGDCLFIPQNWYHQVNSFGKRNLAVNLWWVHLPWFNYTDCELHPADSLPPHLGSYPALTDDEDSRYIFLSLFDNLSEVTRTDFMKFAWIQNGVCVIAEEGDEPCTSQKVEKMFGFLDADNDDILSWEELLTFNTSEFLDQFSDVIVEEAETEVGEIEEQETVNVKPEATNRDEF